jgi:hypothetical protein
MDFGLAAARRPGMTKMVLVADLHVGFGTARPGREALNNGSLPA